MIQDRMSATFADDRASVTIKLLPASGASGHLVLNLDKLTSLIGWLAKIRENMAFGQGDLPLRIQDLSVVGNTPWWVRPEPLTGGVLFAFHHPGYGLLGVALPNEDAVAASYHLLSIAARERQVGNA